VHRVVDTILAYRGCEVISATSGEEALGVAMALPQPPHLIISDVMMPGMDGFTLIRQLRAQSQLALTPVIFLTALDRSDDRMQGYRLGADDYLPKPFHAEELDLRVGRVLARLDQLRLVASQLREREQVLSAREQALLRREQALSAAATSAAGASRTPAPSSPTQKPDVQGSLEQLGLAALLGTLEMEQRSGVLVISSPRGAPGGRLLLSRGRIVSANVDGPARLRNREAVYALLRCSAGRFEFTAADVEANDEVRATTTALLLEGARRADEARELEPCLEVIDRLLEQ
jgi:CheY-like chemotaxis protein